MALLAEPKRKAKFGLDPRNTNWSNDDSKIGQRMLEKMGWEKGKGLGAKEDGIRDHIKATYKSDTRGLGCTPKDADAWIAHQDDFNELLMQLNSQSSTVEPPAEKQEERAPDGHKRYYGRFARGRVPTLRSTEDLNCIFGKRKKPSKPSTPTSESVTNSGSDSDEKKHGITTIKSSSSVQEYFSQKMAALKAKREKSKTTESPAEIKVKETDENRVPAVYGAVQFMYDQPSDSVQSDEVEDGKKISSSSEERVEEETHTKREKKTKKKKDKKANCEEVSENANVPNPSHLSDDLEKSIVENGDVDTMTKSKRKKKNNRADATDIVETNVKGNKDTEDCVEMVSLKRKAEPVNDAADGGKRKRRKLGEDQSEFDVHNVTPETKTKKKSKGAATNVDVVVDDPSTTKTDKKSRKRKIMEEEQEMTEQCTETSNKSKKKSKSKEVVSSESVDLEENSSDVTGKKKRKNLSKDKEIVPSESVDTIENLPVSTVEKKSKKKSKNKEIVTSENFNTEENLPVNTDEKKSKKKSKNKEIVPSESVATVEDLIECIDEIKSKEKSKNKEIVPSESINTVDDLIECIDEIKSKKKSKNKEIVPSESINTVKDLIGCIDEIKSKEKSKNKEIVPSESVATVENLSDVASEKKNKKMSKHKDIVTSETVDTGNNKSNNTIEKKNNLVTVDNNNDKKETHNQKKRYNMGDPKKMFQGANLAEIAGYGMTVPIRKY